MKAERKRWTDRGWKKRVNWKRSREEGPDLRGCGVASLSSLYITISVCVCVCVCLRGDSVVDLMRAKLIRDSALRNSTMTFPQEPGQHLPPILHPAKRERHHRDVFIHRSKLIFTSRRKMKKVSAICLKLGQWKEHSEQRWKGSSTGDLVTLTLYLIPFFSFTTNFFSSNASGGVFDHVDINIFILKALSNRYVYSIKPKSGLVITWYTDPHFAAQLQCLPKARGCPAVKLATVWQLPIWLLSLSCTLCQFAMLHQNGAKIKQRLSCFG